MSKDTSETGTATVFISHASDDTHLARQVRAEFESQGLLCWDYGQEIAPGSPDWRQQLAEAITNATCVVVMWTTNSVGRNWVIAEAEEALAAIEKTANKKNKLLQLIIDGAKPPMPFRGNQGVECSTTDNQLNTECLGPLISHIKDLVDLKGPKERILHPRKFSEQWDCEDRILRHPAPGTDIFVSFHPCADSGIFTRVRAGTTDGWVKQDIHGAVELHAPYKEDPDAVVADPSSKDAHYLRTKNEVFLINDPVRPYSIQIGRLRSLRSHKVPKYINCKISEQDLRHIGLGDPGMCELLASVLEDSKALELLSKVVNNAFDKEEAFDKDEVDRIESMIARNPHSSEDFQQRHCLFCNDTFKEKFSVRKDTGIGAYILENSFPFGPYFHYIVITLDAIHSWENLEFHHVLAMNNLAITYTQERLSNPATLDSQAAGIEYGFNSTVKHLVLGRRTHTSAGASIPHVHKQIWGMAPRTSNLAEQLILVSDAYWRQGIDYQMSYYSALSEQGLESDFSYIVWQDSNVALYVPYGQCSKHEMQIMTFETRANITELTDSEIRSLSIAEYLVIRLYRQLNVTSFNQIVLSKLFKDHRAPQFRLVISFVTREVDLAMSELSMLYVVDQHPWDSRKEIQKAWKIIEDDVMREINASHPVDK